MLKLSRSKLLLFLFITTSLSYAMAPKVPQKTYDEAVRQRQKAEAEREIAIEQRKATIFVLFLVVGAGVVVAIISRKKYISLKKQKVTIELVEVIKEVPKIEIRKIPVPSHPIIQITRTPAHELDPSHILIDGSSIIRGFDDEHVTVTRLFALCQSLLDAKKDITCVLDGSTVRKLHDHNRSDHQRLTKLIREASNVFSVSPPGKEADIFLLDMAHRNGYPIISNDKFRDRSDTYPWVTDTRRVIRFSYTGDIRIAVECMGVDIKLRDLRPEFISELVVYSKHKTA